MARNVVIAGGGFGGANAARELERILPKQSARLIARQRRQLPALHAVPARGRGGDAGAAPRRHAAARHPQAHLPAARGGHRPRPGARGRSSCRLTTARPRSCRYDQLLARARARCRRLAADPRASTGTRSASRASPTRSGSATTSSRRSRRRTRPRIRRDARQLLTYVFVGGGYAGLEALAELQDFAADAIDALSARPAATACAGCWSRPPSASCPRSTPSLAEYALRRAPRPRHRRSALGDHASRRSNADSRRALDRRDASRPGRWSGRRA